MSTSPRSHRSGRIRSRVIDYALYITITFTSITMAFVILDKWGHEAFIRFGGLAAFTSILFGCFVSESRPLLRERRFWLLTSLLLATHLALFMIILTHVDEWRLMWFTGMVLEYPAFLFFRGLLPGSS